jgi:hypothetical protein
MADEEHLAILNQGVEAWNDWRNKNPDERPILRNLNLVGVNLIGVDLHKAILIGTNLSGAILHSANLQECIFSTATLYNTDIRSANLAGADLRWANFCNSFLQDANLQDIDASYAKLDGSNLLNANLCQAKFYASHLSGALLAGADLSRADFTRAELRKAELIQAKLLGTNFTEANLSEAGLTGVQAWATVFERVKLTGACIEDWHLVKANLNDISCDYVYLENQKQRRFPINRNFSEGEFTKLFEADHSYNRLAVLDQIICRFEKLLNDNPQGNESLFHNFLKENPSLLDLYGIVESEPQFYYPSNEFSPTGKSRLEPDFIIRYPGNRFKLVEIEKPGKQIATKQGHPTSQFTQAAWQLGEWEHYIQNYPHLLKEKYPGIPTHRSFMLVIGRRISSEYMELLPKKFPHDEVFTYDDLLDKAKQAHAALVALSI